MNSAQIRQCISEIEDSLHAIAAKNGMTVDELYRQISDYLVIRPDAAKPPATTPKPVITDRFIWNEGQTFAAHESVVVRLRREKS